MDYATKINIAVQEEELHSTYPFPAYELLASIFGKTSYIEGNAVHRSVQRQ